MAQDIVADATSASRATEAARRAARMRAGWLVAVSEGEASLVELIMAATRDGGEPLLKVRVDDLIVAAAHLPPRKRNLVIARLRLYLGVSDDVLDKQMTVGWLTRLNIAHPSSGLRRLAALFDAIDPSSETRAARVEGFPFTAPAPLRASWGG